ncbi:MAG: sporulation protein [Bacillus sp. (in: firmicutes)]
MFKKLLSSVGIGAAKVDTQLSKTNFIVGEKLEGIVLIQGGQVDQEIDSIYLSLFTEFEDEIDDKKITRTAVIEKFELLHAFTIAANEKKEIPFSFMIPYVTPATLGKTNVWVQTGLDIKMAVDPQDRDYIKINPHPLVTEFLQAVENLGFRLRKVDCEKAPVALRNRVPFVQEFEFKPYRGEFAGRLDELEAVFTVSEQQVDVLLQVDRRARGFGGFLAEALEMDESYVRFSYSRADVPSLSETIAGIIRRYS